MWGVGGPHPRPPPPVHPKFFRRTCVPGPEVNLVEGEEDFPRQGDRVYISSDQSGRFNALAFNV